MGKVNHTVPVEERNTEGALSTESGVRWQRVGFTLRERKALLAAYRFAVHPSSLTCLTVFSVSVDLSEGSYLASTADDVLASPAQGTRCTWR